MDLSAVLAVLGAFGVLVSIAAAVGGALLYLRGEVAKLREEMEGRFRLERETGDRVYALRADLARLDERTQAIEKSVGQILDCVRQVQDTLANAR